MFKYIRNLLFLFNAETAHYLTLNILNGFLKIPGFYQFMRSLFFVKNEVTFLGLTFANRVGLAAGFDKNAKYLKAFMSLGFGFVEIGTVTPKPQYGNDKPRLFRLVKDEAIINRMGFNNDGVEAIATRLVNRPKNLIIGGNIGKNKLTPNEQAQVDYEICFKKLYDLVDYFVVNVSSPNTPNLRALQDKEPLTKILSALVTKRLVYTNQGKPSRPILLKIAPDLTTEQLNDVVDIVAETKIDGLVATNTTISRENLIADQATISAIGAGGLSGKILFKHSTQVLAHINQKCGGTIPLIGVGGIDSTERAEAKLKNGATLVQLYTGFIYKGPSLVKQIAAIKH